ncbi:hypothetical protein [Brasilonema bromeliae]|uniref:hypothetical protein n=1 Tax=Brasilonema bromeliae TaxID=383615 RepID=UPI001FE627AA|nr:hypothetical protein [Brasilonema bromeliae]
MTPQLQQIFHSLNELTQSERWQVFDYLVNQLKNALTRSDVLDRSASQQPPKRSPQEIFASTQGSWSHQTRDEIDAQLASQRVKDWASEAFGQSILSKRKIVFSTSDDDTEFA